PRAPSRRGLAVCFVALCAALWPGVAVAHGEETPAATDYRVTITRTPDIPGVSVRVVEAGARLELRNEGDDAVEVLGYSGEPYAELRPDGVYVNVNSPAAYLNESMSGETETPAQASPAAAPRWEKAGDAPVLRWHEHRAHWMSSAPPPVAADDPGRDHRILEWTVPLRTGTVEHEVTGTLDWVAPPATSTWLAGTLLLAGGVVALLAYTRAKPKTQAALTASMIGLAGATAIADAAGRSLVTADAQAGWLAVLATGQAWPAAAGAAATAAAGYAAARKPAADLAVGLAGATLLMVVGLSRFPALTSAITPTPWTGDVARTLLTATLGLGAGLAVAVALQSRQAPTRRITA
ncbi:MAG: hypothetical protein ACRDXX_06645, partial [Stackebrandtia sp.]